MTNIHPTAQVSPQAELADDVTVGPYSIITEHVRIGPGTRIEHHATITGRTTMGEHNNIYPYTAIGLPPQDLTYKNEPNSVEIGHHNIIREFVTINAGSHKEEGQTRLGNHNYLMAYCHIAHDCLLTNHIVMANGIQLGGHVHVGEHAGIGGMCGVHHFVTIGEHSFIAGLSRLLRDAPPYMLMEGHPARVRAVNTVGMERRDFSPETIQAIKDAHKIIWRSRQSPPEQALRLLEKQKSHIPEIKNLIEFLRKSKAGKQGRARDIVHNSR